MSLVLIDKLNKNRQQLIEFKKQIIEWQMGGCEDYTHEVTLTFPHQPKDRWHAEKTFKKFQKILTERCFKKSENKSIKMAVNLEGQKTDNLHYHCAMRCPSHMSIGYFSYRVDSVWKDVVKNEYTRICIKKYTDNGWFSYISKEIKPSHTDVISECTNIS